MKNAGLVILLLFLLGCRQKTYHVDYITATDFVKNTEFASYENISLPKFDSLKTKYQLDTIFHGEQDEFKRMLLLRNWIKNVIRIDDFADSYPGYGHAESILDAALKGCGFHCEHYMIVQNAVMNAYGYITRCLGAGPGVEGGPDGHHGMNEIWSNKYKKWFLSDAKYNHHFEKNSIPLSALEVRDEYLKNKAVDIVLAKGPDRTPIEYDSVANNKGIYKKKTKEQFAQVYTWLEWDRYNDRYSAWPDFNGMLNMYKDEYFKNHTWIWDGKPHWAYKTDHVKYIVSRKAIEWTPNTLRGDVLINKSMARIALTSITPNFMEYRMKVLPDGNWRKCDSIINLPLDQERIELSFCAVNVANVFGSEYMIKISSK